MGAINSATFHRDYPKGPPSCNQCPPGQLPTARGGFIGLPTNETCIAFFGTQGCTPAISGWTSPAIVFLYVCWALTICLALFWACFKSKLFHDRKRRAKDDSSKRSNSEEPPDEETQRLLPESRVEEELIEDESRRMTIEYLRSSKAEHVTTALVVLNGIVLFVYYVLLTVDFYLECENVVGSVDNACFFGTFRIFGEYENNAEIFFLVWIVMVVYCVFLAFFWQDLFDWVSAPASDLEADKVRVWVQDEAHILGSGHLSWATRLKRGAEARFRRLKSSAVRAIWGETAAFQSARQGRYSTVPIKKTPFGRRFFVFEAVRYAVPGGARVKLTLENPMIGSIRGLRTANGPDETSRADMLDRCGPNAIPLTLPTFGALILEEFMNPFYAYQLTIYLIWIWWTYWFVGLWLLIIVFAAGMWSVYLKRWNLREVYALAEHHEGVMKMQHQRDWAYISDASNLVCGDVVKVEIEKGKREWIVPADLVLTDGSCAVDESGLTGESMPRSKTSISSAQRDASLVVSANDNRFKGHILYAGTKVLEASPDAAAVVLAVGTDASRGQLLSHVLFPVKTLFRFDEEFSVAVFLLLCYALVAFCIAIGEQVNNNSQSTWPTILAYGVMTVSQTVSPMLKIALVAGRVTATGRLKQKGIACLDANRIDIAGKVRVFCFDKTGTLTQDGLSFMGFQPSVKTNNLTSLDPLLPRFPSSHPATKAAATCHALAYFDGRFLGSSVEAAMFKATEWSLTGDPDEACSPDAMMRTFVRRRLAFDQHRRLMSVVVDERTQASPPTSVDPPYFMLYVKGAPESVIPRCVSGVPADILTQAEALASEGCYVLAVAQRRLEGPLLARSRTDAVRDELEADLECLGLLVFRNELKPEAAHAIQELKDGHVRCVMITGDSASCGSFIAKQCGLVIAGRKVIAGSIVNLGNNIEEVQWRTLFEAEETTWPTTFALLSELGEPSENDKYELTISGDAFERLRFTGELFDRRLLLRTRVFARMSPTQKVQAVHAFMDGPEGVVCAMCGDGGNDSGALRAAHAGLSMSAAEASVVAPFSSSTGSVMACVDLILEGRAALATSLASYKYLVVYGLLFSIVKLTSFQYAVLMPLMGYVMIDIIAVVPLTFAMTLAQPLKHLGQRRPTSSLLGLQTVSSLTGFLIIAACAMAVNLSIMSSSTGYVRWPAKGADTAAWWYISDNYEATVIWVTCFLLFISSTFIFSFGSGYRASVFRNYALVTYVIALYVFAGCILCLPFNWLSAQFHIASEQFNRVGTENPVWQKYQAEGGLPSPPMSTELRVLILVSSTIAVILAMMWERFVVFGPIGAAFKRAYRKRSAHSESAKEFTSF